MESIVTICLGMEHVSMPRDLLGGACRSVGVAGGYGTGRITPGLANMALALYTASHGWDARRPEVWHFVAQ